MSRPRSSGPSPAPGRFRRTRPTSPAVGVAAAVGAAALLLLLLLPAPLAGQGPPGAAPAGGERAVPTVEVAAFGGILAPLARLTTDPESFETEVSASGLVGGDVTWWVAGRLGLSGRVAWAPAELTLIPTDFTGALPDELGDADYLSGTAEVRYRLPVPAEAELLRPYLALGGGVRRLSVDPIAEPEVTDATDPVATAAAGSHVRLGSALDLRFELRDRVSRYRSPTTGEERIQNDLSVTVGLAAGLP